MPVPVSHSDRSTSGAKIPRRHFDRWRLEILPLALTGIVVVSGVGCRLLRTDGNDELPLTETKDPSAVPVIPATVGDAARPIDHRPLSIVGVGVVHRLPGTGGAPEPSDNREQLLEEIKRRDVPGPQAFLEQDDTAMVVVRTNVPPAARRGDRLDVLVEVPIDGGDVADLSGGWLLETRMREQIRVRGGPLAGPSLRTGETFVIAAGRTLTEHAAGHDIEDEGRKCGVVIGGGIVQEDRPLTLRLRPDHAHGLVAKSVAEAINRRLTFFDGSRRRGIAEAIDDHVVRLDVVPRYRHSVPRMLAVVARIGNDPDPAAIRKRTLLAAQQINDAETARDAALTLEAIGDNAVPALLEALAADSPATRFHAATSLAYLDRVESVEPLIDAIRAEPAFRAEGLLALQTFDHVDADAGLRQLLKESSAETRCGAWAALTAKRDADHPPHATRCDRVGDDGPPMIAVWTRKFPAVAVFGNPAPVRIPSFLRGDHGVMIRNTDGGISVSRFEAGKPDQLVDGPATVAGVVRALTQVGLDHGDIAGWLRLLKDQQAITDPLVFDAAPDPRLRYEETDDA